MVSSLENGLMILGQRILDNDYGLIRSLINIIQYEDCCRYNLEQVWSTLIKLFVQNRK